MASPGTPFKMKTYKNLWKKVISFENLEKAYWKARKRKSNNPKIKKFEEHWRLNLCILMRELRNNTYKPKPLKKFVLRDPKTRVICVSEFRDRIIHHSLVNILQPIFEPRFIHDSYASRKGRGTLTAIQRFDKFKRKASNNGKLLKNARTNNDVKGYVLKADIKHYFQTVNHKILMDLINKRIKDENIMWLVRIILDNYIAEIEGVGMPLGNWTSQFFANIYLDELDQFVKHKLKIKYYLRYVDDFVILHRSRKTLEEYRAKIKEFIKTLELELHPDKCRIIPLRKGTTFLGYRIFYNHKLVRRRNLRKIKGKLKQSMKEYKKGKIDAWDVLEKLQGWSGYAMHANSYRLRQRMHKEWESRLTKC